MAHTLELETMQAKLGEELGVSDWEPVDQARIDAFAKATGDHQFIHVDPERAATGPFGGTIAHGMLTLSLVPAALLDHAVEPAGTQMTINYGFDTVRFLQPVKSGAEVRVRFALGQIELKAPRQVRAGYDVTVEIKGSDRPALVARNIVMYLLDRPHDTSSVRNCKQRNHQTS